MANQDDYDSFLYHYQNSHFEEDSSNPFKTCISKRKCLSQAFFMSQAICSNQAACLILEDKLQQYADLVDCKDGINNYAESALALASHWKTNGQQWKSGLSEAGLTVKELLTTLPGCNNPSEEGCTSGTVTLSDIQSMFEARRHFRFPQPDINPPQQQLASNRLLQTASTARNESSNFCESENSKRGTYQQAGTTDRNGASSSAVAVHVMADGTDSMNKMQYNPTKMFAQTSGKRDYVGNILEQNTETRKLMDPPSEQNRKICARNSRDFGDFRTAGAELKLQNIKKYGAKGHEINASSYGTQKKSLGTRRFSGVSNKFVPPLRNTGSQEEDWHERTDSTRGETGEEEDERLRHIEPKMVELIRSEIMDNGSPVEWDDIAGLQFAKITIQEIIVWPMLRPDIFTGLRRPPKGILLFGPPGTGKTLIGKCIASQSMSTFFSISASSLTSKWIGDGEKMVRALFAVARVHQPAVVFIDEIDSLLCQRSNTEHESSRRIKTEFLIQLDGAATGEEERILVIGATNRPQELDEAARRRLVKRLYIPLPDLPARQQIVERLMSTERSELSSADTEEVANLTDGYSGADMKNLCAEASLGPIRSIAVSQMQYITPDQVRPVNLNDFKMALNRVRSSVSPNDLELYLQWDQMYGSGGAN